MFNNATLTSYTWSRFSVNMAADFAKLVARHDKVATRSGNTRLRKGRVRIKIRISVEVIGFRLVLGVAYIKSCIECNAYITMHNVVYIISAIIISKWLHLRRRKGK